jgi:RimJ/RimL family protein N-acetyltransferase
MAAIEFPDPPLRAGSVLLRRWTRADVPWIASSCNDISIARWSPVIPHPYTEADAISWLESQEPERLGGHGIDLAVADADGRAAGAIGLNGIDRVQSVATVGYWLSADARGRGTMTIALRLLARWALGGLGLARLELLTDPENHASRRVAERCGFLLEGHLRSHLVIRHSGERRDSLVYGLLADDAG